MEKSKSSLLSSSIFRVRQMVQRVGFKFTLTMARVRTPAPSRLLMALLAGYGVQAMALPTGGQVASGNVTIAAPAGNALNITQTSDKGIINWQSFNVGSGEKVNFLQPGASASTLNRVIGSDPTSIFGQINANGQVFLVNNSGIYFAPGSQVNAAGLVASTLSLADSDYLAGNLSLTGGSGSVVNEGVIKAGFVALAGAQVSNTGAIVADGGTAALAAGGRVTLNLIGSDLVSVSVDAPTAAALVHSGGIVQADGGQVFITAKAADALLATVVNVDGIVQAHSIGSRNGVITLAGGDSGVVNVSGTLDASGKGAGQTGGTVKVTGANVGLFNGTIDASGDAGGGVVRVGGDWHGAGADGDANASQAIVDGTSTINASALTSGKGGNVVVWSQDRTQVAGGVLATGGSASGDGGDVETSSHNVLQASGSVNVSAAKGAPGTWLIDPDNISINSSPDANSNSSTTGLNTTFTSTDYDSNILASEITTALQAGATVTVTTLSAGSGGGSGNHGDIFVNTGVSTGINPVLGLNQVATLTLNAQRNISVTNTTIGVTADGTGTGSLSVNFNAGVGSSGTGSAATNVSTFLMDTNSSINTGAAGNLHITTKGSVGLGSLAVGGDLQVQSTGGAISQAFNHVVVGGNSTFDAGAGTITLGATANDFTGTVGVTNTGANNVSVTDTNSLTLGTVNVGSGTTTFTAGSGVGATLTRTSLPTFAAGGTLALNVGGAAVDTTVASFFKTGAATSVAVAADTGGVADVTIAGAGVLPSLTVSGNLDVTATSDVSQATTGSVLSVTGTTNIHGGAHAVALTNTGNDFTGAVSVSNSGANNVGVTDTNNLTLGVVNVGTGTTTFSAGTAVGSTLTRTTAPVIAGGGALALNAGGVAADATVDAFFATGAADSVAIAAAAGSTHNVTATGMGVLPSLTVSGNLDVTATSDVSQATAGSVLNVTGTTNVHGAGHAIDLSNAVNVFTGAVSVSTTGAHDVSIADNANLALGTLALGSGTNTFTAGTAVGSTLSRTTVPTVESGGTLALSVGGAAPDASVGAYFATGAATSVAIAAAAGATQDVTIAGAGVLTSLSVSGNLDVTAGSDISQATVGSVLDVAGTTNVHGGTNAVDLSNTVNVFTGAVSVSNSGAHAVTVADGGNLTLGTVNVGSATNTFSAGSAVGSTLARGAAAVTSGGTLVLNVGGTAVDTTIATFFKTGTAASIAVAADTGAVDDLTITGAGVLPSLTVSGNLDVTGSTDLSQATTGSVLSVTGTTDIHGGAHAVALVNTGNDFTGAVSVANSGAHAVGVTDTNNLTLGTVNVGTGTSTFTAGTAVGSTLTRTTTPVVAGGGTLAIHVGGATADSTVDAYFASGAADSVAITAAAGSTQNVTATGVGVLPSLTVSGNLDVTATSDVSQATAGSVLAISGTTNVHGGAHAIDLSNTGNDFTGAVSVSNSGAHAVSVTDTNSLALGTVNVGTGTTTFTAGTAVGSALSRTTTPVVAAGGTLVLNVGGAAADSTVAGYFASGAADSVTVTAAAGATQDVTATGVGVLPSLTVSGNLDLTATSDISQATVGSVLAVTGTTNVHGGAHAIDLSNGGNDFTGAVSLSNTGAHAVSVADTNSLTLGTVAIGSGSNTLAAGTGVGSTLTRTTALAIEAGGTLAVDVGGTASDSTLASFFATGAATSVAIEAAAGATQDVTAAGVGVLPSLTVSGNLGLTAGADVSQGASTLLHVGGATSVTAGAHAVDLSHSTNVFGGDVSVTNTGHNAVAIGATGAVHLGTSNVGTGLFTVTTTGGAITEGAHTITQHAGADGSSFSTDGNAITLGGANALAGPVGLHNTGANDVTLTDSGNLVLGTVHVGSGTTTITAGTAQGTTLTRTTTPVVEAGGTVVLDVGGLAVDAGLSAYFGSGAASSVTITSDVGSTLDLSIAGASVLSGIVVSGNLNVTATSDLSQAVGSILNVGGSTAIVAGAHAVDLSHANVLGGEVNVTNTGNHDVAIGASGDLSLGTLTVGSGALTVIGTGQISSSVNIISQEANAGPATFTTGAHPISLQGANDFTGAVSVNNSGNNEVWLFDANALKLGASNTGTNALIIHAGGNLTQTAPLTIHSETDIDVGSHNVVLDQTGNAFTGPLAITATSVTVNATGDIAMAVPLTLTGGTGNVSLDATGSLLSIGNIATTGNVSLTAGNALVTSGTVQGHDVTLVGASVDVHDDVTAAGLLTLTGASGGLTQSNSSKISANGTGTFTALGGNDIALTDTTNILTNVTANGEIVDLVGTGPLTAHLSAGSHASVLSTGVVTVDGSVAADLAVTGNGVVFGSSPTAVTQLLGGTLTVTDNGTGTTVTQNAALALGTGTLALHVGANDVTLLSPANVFGTALVNVGGPLETTGTVKLNDTTALSATLGNVAHAELASGQALSVATDVTGNVTSLIANGASVALGAIQLSGSLQATASTGDITQSGAVDVGNGTTLTAIGHSITLNGANQLDGSVDLSAANIALVDADALSAHLHNVGHTSLSSGSTLTVDGNTITTSNDGDLVLHAPTIVFGDAGTPLSTTVGGALTATATSGGIQQNAALVVQGTGTSTLAASGQAISLNQSTGNSFAGPLDATGSSITIQSDSSLGIAPHLSASGNLTLTTHGAGSALTLAAAPITTTGAVTLTSGAAFTTNADISAGTVAITSPGITINSEVGATTSLTATSTGTIIESGSGFIDAPLATSITAGTNTVTLGSNQNVLGTLTVVTGGDVTVLDSTTLTAHLTHVNSASLTAGNSSAINVDGTTVAGGLMVVADGVTFGSLGTSLTGGDLSVNAGLGGITQTGTNGSVVVNGAHTSLLSANSDIALTNAGNHFGTLVTADTPATVSLADAGALGVQLGASGSPTGDATLAAGNGIAFSASYVNGALIATSGTGAITQGAPITVSGTSNFGTTGADITLGAANAFTGLVTANGANVTLTNAGDLSTQVTSSNDASLTATGGALDLAGDIGRDLTAHGASISFGATTGHRNVIAVSTSDIGQSAPVDFIGTATLDAGNSSGNQLMLTAPTNSFGGAISVQGNDIQVSATGDLTASVSNSANALLHATGVLTASGTTGTTLTLTGNGVVLGSAGTHAGSLLSVNSGTGTITQGTGGVVTATTATLEANGHGVTLAEANHIGDVTVDAGVTLIVNADALSAHLHTVTDATLVAGGELDVEGHAAGLLNATGNGTVTGKGVVFGITQVDGALDAETAGTGAIAQAVAPATLGVQGTSTLNAGGANITLANAGNHLLGVVSATGGTVTLTNVDALATHLVGVVGSAALTSSSGVASVWGSTTGNLSINGSAGVNFGDTLVSAATTVGGTLDAHSSTGGITQSGSLSVTTGPTTLDAGTNDVTLTLAGNHFGGGVAITSGHDVSLSTGDTLGVGGHTTGDLNIVANGVTFGTTNVDGNLDATSVGGSISGGALVVHGLSDLEAGSAAITLANPLNDFTGAVTANGGNVSLADLGTLTLNGHATGNLTLGAGSIAFDGAPTTVDGTLAATATGGTITQTSTGVVHLTGSGGSTLNAGTGAITLATPANTFAGPLTVTGGAVSVAGTGALAVNLASATSAHLGATGAVNVGGTSSGDLTVSGASVAFASGTSAGDVNATATAGDITQSGPITVTGLTGPSTFTASAGSVALTDAGNAIGSTVTANASGAVALLDTVALTATVNAATVQVTDSAAMTATVNATFAQLTDGAALVAHVNAGSAQLSAGGLLTVDGTTTGLLQASGNGVVFGTGATTAGSLTVGAGSGSLTQTGTLLVNGASAIDTGTGTPGGMALTGVFDGAVTLSGTAGGTLHDQTSLLAHLNNVGGVGLTSTSSIQVDGTTTGDLGLNAAQGITFAADTHVAGNLVATSGTGIGQGATGALAVAGTSALTAAPASQIFLIHAANDFGGAVTASGGDVELADANSLTLHLAASSSASVAAGSGASDVLTLDGASTGAVAAAGSAIVFGPGTLQVGGALNAVSGSSSISQLGALSVTGLATFNAGTQAISLGHPDNVLGAVAIQGGVVTLVDSAALAVSGNATTSLGVTGAGVSFGATTVNGPLTVSSLTGDVSQTGAVQVTGGSTITATGHDVTLKTSGNQLGSSITVAAATADIEQTGALVAHVTDTAATILKSGGALSVDGSVSGAASNLTATGASVSFGPAATTVGGNLVATASTGTIGQAGTLAVGGTSTLAAGSAVALAADASRAAALAADGARASGLTGGSSDIVLDNVGNAFTGAVTATGANVTLKDTGPLTAHVAANGSATLRSTTALSFDGESNLTSLTGGNVTFGSAGTQVNGALQVSSTGITQAGALSVKGASNLAAGAGDIALDTPGANLVGAVTASGANVRITDTAALDATVTASGDTALTSASDVKVAGGFVGALKVSGAKVTFAAGLQRQPDQRGQDAGRQVLGRHHARLPDHGRRGHRQCHHRQRRLGAARRHAQDRRRPDGDGQVDPGRGQARRDRRGGRQRGPPEHGGGRRHQHRPGGGRNAHGAGRQRHHRARRRDRARQPVRVVQPGAERVVPGGFAGADARHHHPAGHVPERADVLLRHPDLRQRQWPVDGDRRFGGVQHPERGVAGRRRRGVRHREPGLRDPQGLRDHHRPRPAGHRRNRG